MIGGHRIRSRGTGVALLAMGCLIAVAVVVAPVPAFDDLHRRPGTLVDARRDRFSPCRSGDCTRTLVTVRHEDGTWEYHFGDADPERMQVGEPITVWTYPTIRGLDGRRVWHAVQNGRVIRDHGRAATADRRIRLGLVLVMPFLIGIGWRLARRYDWQGRRTGHPSPSLPP
jgi:hypothetical protein